MNTWNRHRESEIHKTLEIGSGTKLLFTFLCVRFFDMRRERHNFFLCWLFHLTPTMCGPLLQTTGLASASSKNLLPSSNVKSQLQLTQPTCGARSAQSFLASPRSKSRLTVFFQIPKILSASGHDVFHVPGPISYLGFLLWHLWLSHLPRVRMNTCAQCVHLTNPCTKRKVLSLTKPKGKIYKTKSLRKYITKQFSLA